MYRILGAAAALLLAQGVAANAQPSKTLTGETKTLNATVEAIEQASREVTVKKTDGTHEVLYVPQTIKRFDQLKVGDRVSARYYETIVVQLKSPGDQDKDLDTSAVTPNVAKLGGTRARQRTITATITAIDPTVPSITFKGPRDWSYSSRVKDKDALAKVKVGDQVAITWTEALLVSLDDAK